MVRGLSSCSLEKLLLISIPGLVLSTASSTTLSLLSLPSSPALSLPEKTFTSGSSWPPLVSAPALRSSNDLCLPSRTESWIPWPCPRPCPLTWPSNVWTMLTCSCAPLVWMWSCFSKCRMLRRRYSPVYIENTKDAALVGRVLHDSNSHWAVSSKERFVLGIYMTADA